MVDSEHSSDSYKFSKISSRAMKKKKKKKKEMLRFVLDQRKIQKMCKHAVKSLL